MNLRQLEYFKMLAELEHMTQTAETLNTTQPNLSHAMSELEKELGVKLFEKSGRNIKLTKYGSFFYQYVTNSLNELELGTTGIKELINPNSGVIDLGFVYSMGQVIVPKIMHDFKKLSGNENVTFTLQQNNGSGVLNLLLDGTVDIAIGSKIDNYDMVHFDPLVEQKLVLVVPENHPLAIYDEIDLKQTTDYPYILFHKDNGARSFIDNIFNQIGITPEVAYEVEEDITFAGFVAYGHGIGIVPNFFLLKSYPVKIIQIKNPYPKRYLYLATHKTRLLTPTTQRFVDYIKLIAQSEAQLLAMINGIDIT